ncbi:MAG TPA: tail fiber domain-containing protein, partial [Bacteroidales bacterium]|nr:tail fiber domain-containing protein [Bacteroidales bacterium]
IMARLNGVPGRLALQREGGELSIHDMAAAGTQFIVKADGKVGFGTSNPSSRFELATGASWSDETPLFEVKNNDGITVFAVYNNGVRVTVEDDPSKKGRKGGFAIGGFDPTKSGETVDFMRITPDSIRFNINNNSSKGPKGGFAIGGFDRTKGLINEDFMYITPQGSSTGGYNTSLGYQAGYSLAGGFHNVMVGYRAGYYTDGYYTSDFLCDGTRNIFIGNYAGYDNVSGKDNIAVGFEAGRKILGNENIYVGTGAGKDLTGSRNIIIGKYTDGWFGSEEDDNFVLSNGTGSTPLLSGNFSQRVIAIDGNLYVYDAYDNNVGGADLYIASNGMVGTLASSRRFKENITAMDDIRWFYELEPVEFSYIEDPLHARQYGLIAEEVEKIDPYFVSYNQEGQVYTVTYSKLISPMIKVIQDQDDRISSLEDEIDQLRQLLMEIAGQE